MKLCKVSHFPSKLPLINRGKDARCTETVLRYSWRQTHVCTVTTRSCSPWSLLKQEQQVQIQLSNQKKVKGVFLERVFYFSFKQICYILIFLILQVKTFYSYQDEPGFTQNIKRGLASLFQLQLHSGAALEVWCYILQYNHHQRKRQSLISSERQVCVSHWLQKEWTVTEISPLLAFEVGHVKMVKSLWF